MLNIKEIIISSESLANLYINKSMVLPELNSAPINSYFILRSDINTKHSALVRHWGKGLCKLLKKPELNGTFGS